MKEAERALGAEERSLKAQFGKKRESWPAEATERLLAAREAASLAQVAYRHGQPSKENTSDSIEDVEKAIVGAGLQVRQEHLQLVSSAADAQLVVQIKARRSAFGTGGLFGRFYYVLFAIKAGPLVTAEQFASVPRSYDGGWAARPRPDAPEWLFESLGQGSWKMAGGFAAMAIDRFAKAHASVLSGAAAAQ